MKKAVLIITSILLVFGISMSLTIMFQSEEKIQMQEIKQKSKQLTKNNEEANIEKIEETIIYENKLISKELVVGWTPINPDTILNMEDISINAPQLISTKKSYTEADYLKNNQIIIPEKIENNSVKPGEKIIYEIEIKNIGNIDAKNIKVKETLPEQTTFEYASPFGKESNGKVTWVINIPKQTQIKLYYVVSVKKDAVGIIKNVAIVNGEETNKTENPIIEEEKEEEKPKPKANITRQKISDPASESIVEYGDTITYTIIVGNTGTASKKVVIKDNIPENTEFVEVLDGGEEVAENEIVKAVKWEKTVKPGEEISLKFKVKVTGNVTNTIKNIGIVDGISTNETIHKITKKLEATSIRYTGKNIILVLDLSSSMLDPAANGKIRLDVLKQAAKNFIDTTLQNENNTISLITFNYDTKENAINSVMNMENGGQWAVNVINSLNPNIVGTKIQFKSSKNANELKTFIDSIELKKPLLTNIQEAMNKTLEEVNRLYNLDSKKENVVLFIGDGAPSCTSYTNGNEGDNGTGYGTSQNYGFTTQEETEKLITNYTNQIKKKAKIYAIGYELAGEDEWKQDISNNIIRCISNGKEYYYDASASNLNSKFEQISTSISEEKKQILTADIITGKVEINLIENAELQINQKTPVILKLGEEVIEFDTIEKIINYFQETEILQFNNSKFIIDTTKIPKEKSIKLIYYYK